MYNTYQSLELRRNAAPMKNRILYLFPQNTTLLVAQIDAFWHYSHSFDCILLIFLVPILLSPKQYGIDLYSVFRDTMQRFQLNTLHMY